MPKLTHRLPKYRLHKASGQAVVTLGGFDHYLGQHGTDASRQAYQRKVTEWLASNRLGATQPVGRSDLTIDEVFVRYWAHVTTYYVKEGRPTGEQHALRSALTPLVTLYGPTPAAGFGPLELKAVREWMIQRKLSRKLINSRVNRIRRMFKWAVENAYLIPAVLQGLQAVSPLKRGRCEAPETDPVRPLPEDEFERTLSHLAREVRAMAMLQWLTGMRPGEIVVMRTRDIDRSGEVWEYRPASHKTQHHGIERSIQIGPRGQQVLSPFLRDDNPDDYLFSPERRMREHHRRRRERRVTPMTPSQSSRRPMHVPARAPGPHYTSGSYGQAIAKACKQARVPVWGPNRLRHTFATRVRKKYGLDEARVILGHRSAEITEIYAELDRTKAVSVIAQIG